MFALADLGNELLTQNNTRKTKNKDDSINDFLFENYSGLMGNLHEKQKQSNLILIVIILYL
jgi:hypothetical protein